MGSTGVLVADGSSKPISQVKVGDWVGDSMPRDATLQTQTVQKTVITQIDADFMDLTAKTLVTAWQGCR